MESDSSTKQGSRHLQRKSQSHDLRSLCFTVSKEIYLICCFRKIPILGKHTKKITCGAWSQENLLALGSQDQSITISKPDGDTIRHAHVRGDPANISFSEMKGDTRSTMGDNTV